MAATGGRTAPIQIRAQFLEDMVPPTSAEDTGAFSAMPVIDAGCRQIKRGHWLEKDLQRAIGVARRSGLADYCVEVAPDGTIAIVVGHQPGKRPARRHS